MKKVLVMMFVLVLGLGLGLTAQTTGGDFSFGNLSGSWETEITLGFTDVVITDPGATFTIPAHTYPVSQGTVTIGDQVVTGTYQGSPYSVTVPGDTYTVGPWSITIPGDTYNVTAGSFTIPAQAINVDLPDGTVLVTIPAKSFEVPDFANKEANISFPVEEKEIDLVLPHVEYSYSGTVGYSYILYLQTSSTVLQVGTGTFPLEVEAATTLVGPTYNCTTMCWEWPDSPYPTVALPGFHREIHPDGKTFQVDIDPETVVVKQDDAIFNGFVLLVGRTASGLDSLGNRVEIIVDNHNLDLSVVVPATITIPQNWAYTPAPGFEGHYLVFEIPEMKPALVMPAGWNRCCELGQPTIGRPSITVGLDNLDVYFYQVTGTVDESSPTTVASSIWTAILADNLDKVGLCFVNTESKTYEFAAADNKVTIPFDDLEGTALLGSFVDGTQTITIPAYDVEGTYAGGTVDIPVPAMTVTISGQTVTTDDYTFSVAADSIVVPDFLFTITVDDQDIDITIAGGTYIVSAQTVTIPLQTVIIPGWTQTITRIPTVDFTATLIVDYTVCGWVFNSTSEFEDTGWTAQSFAADGVLGAFTLDSYLEFSPADALFTAWDTTVAVSIAGVAFDGRFMLVGAGSASAPAGFAGGAGWAFGASSSVGDCDFGATVYFNSYADPYDLDGDGFDLEIWADYCFCFSSVEFDVSFPFACIDLVDISLGFSSTGFDGVTFSVTGIAVPGLPWLTFDVDLTFNDGTLGKEMVLTPAFDLGDFTCITLYYGFGQDAEGGTSCGDNGVIIEEFQVYAVELDYTWNGVSFYSLSILNTSLYIANVDPYWDDAYWEVFTISSEADACCGGAFDFSVSSYFACDSELLFDWALTEIEVGMGLGSNFSFNLGLMVDTTSFTEFSFGFEVTW